jgi:hypothetical protein
MEQTQLEAHEGTQFPTTREMRMKALTLLSGFTFDTIVTYQQFTDTLGLNPALDRRARSAVLQAGRDLLKAQNKKLVNVKTEGYRIIRPNEHKSVSQSQQRSARRKLRDALQTVTHVALENLTPKEVAEVMLEQARTALQLNMTRRVAKMTGLPSKDELHMPSSAKLLSMMRKTP